MPSLRDLQGGAREVLDAFVAQLEDQGIELPERRYVAPGSAIVWDGEQMTVNLVQVLSGQPGAPGLTTPTPPATRVFHATWAITLLRAVPALEVDGPVEESIPTSPEIEESGLETMADSQGLLLAAQAIHEGYVLTRPGMGFVVNTLQTLGPEGGLAGVRLQVSLSLN